MLLELQSILFDAATRSGVSLSYFDIRLLGKDKRDSLINCGENQIKAALRDHCQADPRNPLSLLYLSGARGNWMQVCQLIAFKDKPTTENRVKVNAPLPLPSLTEGLSPFQYAMTCPAMRRTMIDKKLVVASAGHLTRELVECCYEAHIAEENCGSGKGVLVPRALAVGRHLTEPMNGIPETRPLEPEDLKKLPDAVRVRSPATCQLPKRSQICQHCYGLDQTTHDYPPLGALVGILAAQSIGERGTQEAMRTFHSAGMAKPFSITKAQRLLLRKGPDSLEDEQLRGFWDRISASDLYKSLDRRHFEVVLRQRLFGPWAREAFAVASDIRERGLLPVMAYRSCMDTICHALTSGDGTILGSESVTNPKLCVMLARQMPVPKGQAPP